MKIYQNIFPFFCLMLIMSSANLFAWSSAPFKKLSKNELKKKLSTIQYQVTQEEGTEAPYKNEFFDNHQDGIYVDIVSGDIFPIKITIRGAVGGGKP